MSKTFKIKGFVPLFISYDYWKEHADFPLTRCYVEVLSSNPWKKDKSKNNVMLQVTGSYYDYDNSKTKTINLTISASTLFGFNPATKFMIYNETTNETKIPNEILLAKKGRLLEIFPVFLVTKKEN